VTIFYLFYDWRVVACVHIFVFIVGVINLSYFRGLDWNHIPLARHTSQCNLLYVSAHYHLMHHKYPDNYFSSVVTLFDRIVGMGCQIQGRSFVVTGAGGEFGNALCAWLLEHGAAKVTPCAFATTVAQTKAHGAMGRSTG
jgi:monoglucosyldiacylglycerol epimerase